jgi:hypothetical protein
MTDLATEFVRKIKHKMDRSREVLPANTDLLDIATERFAYIFKDKGELDEMSFLGVAEGRQLFMLGLARSLAWAAASAGLRFLCA